MKKVVFGLSILIATASIISCGQKTVSKYPGYDKVDEQMYVKYFNDSKEGRVVAAGDILTVSMTYTRDDDSVLFESTNAGQPVQLRADTGLYVGDIMSAFIGMNEGDSVSIIVRADSFYLKTARYPQVPAFIDSGSVLYFSVGINKVESLEELQAAQAAKDAELAGAEMQILENYLTTNGITVPASESGLIYIPTIEGTGKQAVAGKKVKVNYAGRLLDGTYFDTSIEQVAKEQGIFDERRSPYSPFEFDLGKSQVIRGWDEGIAMMKEGGKAQLIIPSSIAYGANPRPGGPIQPYSTLIFDVELIEVMD